MTMAANHDDLASHYQSPWLRQLPHYRTWLPAVLRSCRLSAERPSVRWRRIAFLCLIVLRFLEWLWFCLVIAITRKRPGFFLSTIWLVGVLLAFLLVAWNLQFIVEAQGSRRVWKVTIPSGVFTGFLWWLVIVHIFLISLEVSGFTYFYGSTLSDWAFWIAAVVAVAWVTVRGDNDNGVILT